MEDRENVMTLCEASLKREPKVCVKERQRAWLEIPTI